MPAYSGACLAKKASHTHNQRNKPDAKSRIILSGRLARNFYPIAMIQRLPLRQPIAWEKSGKIQEKNQMAATKTAATPQPLQAPACAAANPLKAVPPAKAARKAPARRSSAPPEPPAAPHVTAKKAPPALHSATGADTAAAPRKAPARRTGAHKNGKMPVQTIINHNYAWPFAEEGKE